MGGIYFTKTIFKSQTNCENLDIGCDSGQNQTDFVDPQEAGALDSQTLIKFEYHIVYSISYSVPVLYFTANKSDGSLIQLEDICKWIPKIYKTSETEVEIRDESDLYREFGSILTQMEHPLLLRPFYCIHPCHTSTLMKNIFGINHFEYNRSPERDNYLISWLSTMGPMVGLQLSLDYAK